MKNLISFVFCLAVALPLFSQKKIMDHRDFDLWNTIQNSSLSADGNFIMYSLEKGEKDQHLKIHDNSGLMFFEHERGENGSFSFDSNHAIFLIKAWKDSVREMKRRKVKKDDMPLDTLAIVDLNSGELTKIPNHQSHKIPVKWGGFLAYQVIPGKEENGKEKSEPDSTRTEPVKIKKQDKKNGYHLILHNLETQDQDTFKYVTQYIFAREGKRLAFVSTGETEDEGAGVFVYNLEEDELTNIHETDSKITQLSFSRSGTYLGYVSDPDTTKVQVRPFELYRWSESNDRANLILDNSTAPEGYLVSDKGSISFNRDEDRMFIGLATPQILQDTSRLEDEIVNVEVWTYDEPLLYTVQEMRADREKNRTYEAVIHLQENDELVQIASTEYPDASMTTWSNEDQVLVSSSAPYQRESQWLGATHRDYALVDVNTGANIPAVTNIRGRVQLSPGGKYILGYDENDSSWFTYGINTGEKVNLTRRKVFYNELNDSPDLPNSYGTAGWTTDDQSVIIYDRYDIWRFNPDTGSSERLTEGRENREVYRYLQLDRENPFIEEGKWLLSVFDEKNKDAGYVEFNSKNKKITPLLRSPHRYSRPVQAENGKGLIFTRQSFIEFPDIHYSRRNFKDITRISHANPHQSDYNWGTAEIVKWTSLDGLELEGMLIKPENFDPNKKYPLLVNFYEKSSNGLHNHRTPSPGRSTINYPFYTSRGYVIFNPDIHYRIGYPGESAYNCVIPGVTSLVEKGFIDRDRIGVQGHSWGGYQIAHLVTQSNIFRAAEAGAPVPNMISAYGGIRWWTGLSRQFQYEHTQSRIGGTPWEYPTRFMENSPIFFIDKIETPLLIMHNDADGHVPWYQGIEFFVALRRLGKPSWFLNYNGEPHWPLKRQNRVDFNIRMQQFFDYYLKDDPMPKWMRDGVPAIEKGINQGYELLESKK